MTLTARGEDRLVRKAAVSLFLSPAGAAEQSDYFVTDENATEANLRGVSR
ncbi:MAG TPA: hypothetical protein VK730_11200 [Solirubrobacteraceae bacterium]|jgi:hypothetical protein|nr:hypothetical protein [Solirubrobacteraceae bacterium]